MATSTTDLRRIMSPADIASVDERVLHGRLGMSQVLCNIVENLKLPLPILILEYESHAHHYLVLIFLLE